MEKPKRIQRIIEGLQILAKYDPDTDITANEEELWVGAGVKPKDEDRKRLNYLGWHEDDDVESWRHYIDV